MTGQKWQAADIATISSISPAVISSYQWISLIVLKCRYDAYAFSFCYEWKPRKYVDIYAFIFEHDRIDAIYVLRQCRQCRDNITIISFAFLWRLHIGSFSSNFPRVGPRRQLIVLTICIVVNTFQSMLSFTLRHQFTSKDQNVVLCKSKLSHIYGRKIFPS